MKKQALKEIKQAIKKAKTAIIAAHIDPDADAIGSSLAMAMLLKKLKVKSIIYSQNGIPKIYQFLPWTEKVLTRIPAKLHFDLAIILDSSVIERVGDKIDLKKMAKKIINIDHHPDNKRFGDINFVGQVSSAAEQIFKLAKYLKIKIDRDMAENLYVAMITDTGNFRYENTKASTFKMAAELFQTGIDPHDITTRIYDNKSIASVKLSALAMEKLEFADDKKVAWTSVTEEMMQKVDAKGEDLIGLVDQIRAISGVEVAILFREDKGKIKVNFRAKSDINVSVIANRLGGGGHHKAAGVIMEGSLLNAREKVLAETLKYLV